jgi:hypothetical protein
MRERENLVSCDQTKQTVNTMTHSLFLKLNLQNINKKNMLLALKMHILHDMLLNFCGITPNIYQYNINI